MTSQQDELGEAVPLCGMERITVGNKENEQTGRDNPEAQGCKETSLLCEATRLRALGSSFQMRWNSVFVGNLPLSMKKDKVITMFSKFGIVKELRFLPRKKSHFGGSCIVEFARTESAADAVVHFHEFPHRSDCSRVYVQLSKATLNEMTLKLQRVIPNLSGGEALQDPPLSVAVEGVNPKHKEIISDPGFPLRFTDLPHVDIPAGRRFSTVITHITTTRQATSEWFYFQVNEGNNLENLSRLERDLTKWCNENPSPCPLLQKGLVVSAKCGEKWRRASVHSFTSDSAVVHLLDYGETVSVFPTHIQRIEMVFLRLPLQAQRCTMHGVASARHSISSFTKYISKAKALEAVLVKKSTSVPFCHVMEFFNVSGANTEENVSAVFAKMVERRWRQTADGQQKLDQFDVEKRPFSRYFADDVSCCSCSSELHSVFPLVITCVKDVSLFYGLIADADSMQGLLNLKEKMNLECDATPFPFHYQPICDEIVCAKAAKDGLWYRALIMEVTSIREDEFRVFYADNGNSEVVRKACIRPIQQSYLTLPMQAIKLRLYNAHSWSSEAVKKFEKMTLMKSLFAEVTGPGGEIALKIPPFFPIIPNCEIPAGGLFPLVITSASSPSDFWAQIMGPSLGKLVEINRKLNESTLQGQPPLEYRLGSGDFCSAQFSEDKLWYRAVVTKVISEHKYCVRFVDFGNSEEVEAESVCSLEEGLEDFSSMAVQLSLNGIGPLGSDAWSEDACQFFRKMVCGKKLMAKLVCQPSFIDLFDVTHETTIFVNKAIILAEFARKN